MVNVYIRLPKGHQFGNIDFLSLDLQDENVLSEVAVMIRALNPARVIMYYNDPVATDKAGPGLYYIRRYNYFYPPEKPNPYEA